MRRLAVCSVLTGCFSKPAPPHATHDASHKDGAEVDSVADARQTPNCDGIAFDSDPVMTISELGPVFLAEPTMTADMREVYFTSDPDPNGETYLFDIRRAVRNGPGEEFTLDPGSLPFNTISVADGEASITGDGLMIAFVSRRGSDRAYYATRTDRMSGWSGATLMPGLEDTSISSLDLSEDGLTLYYPSSSTPSRLLRATRAARTAVFIVEPLQLGDDRLFPAVSFDGLELYYTTGGIEIFRALRPNTMQAFGGSQGAFTGAFDPDLLPGGETLIATSSSSSGILVFQRTCPAL